MKRITFGLTFFVLSLACGGAGGPSELALEECTPPDDATECDKCFLETCQQECYACVDDPECYDCTQSEGGDDCLKNEKAALLLTCALGSISECADKCAGEPPPAEPGKPPRLGRRKRGGGGGARPPGGGERGKAGKGGKTKRPH